MNYNKIGFWLKGYLDAVQVGEHITKTQIELLISRVQEMITEIEEGIEEDDLSGNRDSEEDDLPF